MIILFIATYDCKTIAHYKISQNLVLVLDYLEIFTIFESGFSLVAIMSVLHWSDRLS
jgi:hypothetical protein